MILLNAIIKKKVDWAHFEIKKFKEINKKLKFHQNISQFLQIFGIFFSGRGHTSTCWYIYVCSDALRFMKQTKNID